MHCIAQATSLYSENLSIMIKRFPFIHLFHPDNERVEEVVLPAPSYLLLSSLSLSSPFTFLQFHPVHRKLIYCSRTVPEIEKALAELKRLMEYRARYNVPEEGQEDMDPPSEEEEDQDDLHTDEEGDIEDVGESSNRVDSNGNLIGKKKKKRPKKQVNNLSSTSTKKMKPRVNGVGVPEPILALGLSSRKNLCVHPEVGRERKGKVVDARCRDMTSAWACQKGREDPGSVELCSFHEVSSN